MTRDSPGVWGTKESKELVTKFNQASLIYGFSDRAGKFEGKRCCSEQMGRGYFFTRLKVFVRAIPESSRSWDYKFEGNDNSPLNDVSKLILNVVCS